MTDAVFQRAIYFVGGYDPKTPAAFFSKLDREKARFEALWGCMSHISPVEVSCNGEVGTITIDTSSPEQEWRTRTDFNFLVLDSLVLADFAKPLPVRLGKYLAAFVDFATTGTAMRIFLRAWRFGLYFLYPFVSIVLFVILGLMAGSAAARWLGGWGWLVALPAFYLLQASLGERWSINHLMDLWSFSAAFIRQRRPEAAQLMQNFADVIVSGTAKKDYDEIVLVGHSTGGLLILDIAARCLEKDRHFTGRAKNVTILTLGSTALKAGLHPAAADFRGRVATLAADGRIRWVEIQCLTDVINFYKSDPVTEMGLPSRADFPLVKQVRMKDMLDAPAYRRIKRNFFRVHYQYIFGNTKRYWYDFFQIVCGPLPLLERARRGLVGSERPDNEND